MRGSTLATLADTAFSLDALTSAWAEVLANDAQDGALGPGVRAFNDELDDRLARLNANLAWGAYEPDDLTEVTLDRPGKAPRVLHIPTVRDRIVARAILDVVSPIMDPLLGPASYAYRPGLGVIDAVQEVARLRDEGLRWVVRTDVNDCFPSVPVDLARRRFGALADDSDLLRVVDLLLARPYRSPRRGRRVMRGLPQGCPLSPLLANLVLVDLDAALMDEGFSPVRYADDVAIPVESESDGWEALRCASGAVRRLGMELGEEDTTLVTFEDGFTFLGEDFGPRYPPVLATARVEDPERKVLYVGTQGGRVRTAQGRLIVETADAEQILDAPTSHVRRVVAFGSVGVSAGVRSWAMKTGVDVVFASRRGAYQGTLVSSAAGVRAERVRAQLAFGATPQSLELGRSLIEAKVRKQIVVLQRLGRREHGDQVREATRSMNLLLRMIPDAQSDNEIMGLEGAAAAAYFPAFGALFPAELQFQHRTRQPPLDVANSALSFLYTILLGECVTALHATGLDPTFGVLHADQGQRPSLALDVLEELRPFIVDQVVLTAARRGQLQAVHGRSEPGRAGVYLNKKGRSAIVSAYEHRMLTRTAGAIPDFSGTLRRHVYRQAQRLAAAIYDPGTPWTGLTWR